MSEQEPEQAKSKPETAKKTAKKEPVKANNEQAPLALLNLLANGMKMSDAKKKLGIK